MKSTRCVAAAIALVLGVCSFAGQALAQAAIPTISKSFGAASIPLNGSTTLTFSVVNNDPTDSSTEITFTDTLPAGLVIATPNGLSVSCTNAGPPTTTAVAGGSNILFSNPLLQVGGSCTIAVNVTGTSSGAKVNSVVVSSFGGAGNLASATLNVDSPPTINKSFGAPSIPLGGSTSLTFTVNNPNSVALTGVAFTDNLPAGLVVATPSGLTSTCGGTSTATAGSGTYALTGGSVGASSSCSVSLNVTGTTAGVKNNTTGPISSNEGGTGSTSNTASITVSAVSAPTITKAFGTSSIPAGGSTSLTFTLSNPNATPLTGVAFSDNFPAGLVVATPNALASTCGGTSTATAGSGSYSLSGGALAASSSCTVSLNVTGTTPGSKTNTTSALSSNEAPPGAAATASLTVGNASAGTSTGLTSSQNPSTVGQAVTFTASVASAGGTPTGTVTFLDGGSAIGSGTLSGGVAAFTTSSLTAGSHPITASYGGAPGFSASTSSVLTQVVGVPADSLRLRALQLAVTRVEAQASGAAFQGAVDGAISDGFSGGGSSVITPNGGGLHFNFTAEPQSGLSGGASEFDTTMSAREGVLRESGLWTGQSYLAQPSPTNGSNTRVNETGGALGYTGGPMPTKAPALAARAPHDWQVWADVRGTGWNTDASAGDINGGQVNALLGITRRLTPDFLIGVLGGYETFDYSSNTLNGRLKGDGWTAGGYLGWRLWPGLRFDAAVARSGVSYDGVAGTAAATFPGSRWIGSAGLVGTYRMAWLEIEPSAKVYALWERDNQYLDSLGTLQNSNNFSNGRASGGVKFAYPWSYTSMMSISPYVGAYADYYFSNSNSVPLLLPTQFIQGWSARLTAGLNFNVSGGAVVSLGGELGGLGNDFITWSARGRASVPFSFP